MAEYIRRVVDNELDALLPGLPAIAIDGPKAVGKTATALRRAATIFRLDDPGVIEIAAAAPERLVSGPWPILLDEWQRFPASWDLVRRAVDADPAPGRFVLTGSASPARPPTHSGAGRIVSLRMRPLSLAERFPGAATVSLTALLAGGRPAIAGTTTMTLDDYTAEILASGFPGIRGMADRPRRAALDGYLDRIAEWDFPEMGERVRKPATLRRWMAGYAAATATTASLNTIREAAAGQTEPAPSKTTVLPYHEALLRLWIADPVPTWSPSRNPMARLTGAPKHHLADPALAARLIGVGADALLGGRAAGPAVPRDGTLLGALFDSLVTLSVRTYAQAAEARVAHFRTRAGEQEIDLIVERDDRRVVAIEIKLSATVKEPDARHLRWLAGRIGDDLLDAVIVTTGPEAYRRADGIAVVPAALLGP
ncbi:MAG: ATP-binding protein [Candidatus Limnocylindrales bacterium]